MKNQKFVLQFHQNKKGSLSFFPRKITQKNPTFQEKKTEAYRKWDKLDKTQKRKRKADRDTDLQKNWSWKKGRRLACEGLKWAGFGSFEGGINVLKKDTEKGFCELEEFVAVSVGTRKRSKI